MTTIEARNAAVDTLVDALCADKASCWQDRSWAEDIARHGFTGFANMSAPDLVQSARDAGIDKDAKVAEAIRLLNDKLLW